MVSRWWPTLQLIRLAVRHGLTPATLLSGDAFRSSEPVSAPATAARSDIECKPVGWRDGNNRTWREEPFTLLSADTLEAARASVRELQSRVAQSTITGCPPPTFHRILYGCEAGHGRYYVHAPGGVSYQQMPKAQRLARIAINGEAVAEVDVRASQLSIMHGLLGIPLPDGDPYAVTGIPRMAVKAFITETLGVGQAKQRWSAATAARAKAECWPPIHIVSAAVRLRYPFLRSPALVVSPSFLPHVPPEVALCHYLCGIEAEAMTTAMRLLWRDHKALALPIHDSLMVPCWAVDAAQDAIDTAFLTFANVSPTITADLPPAFAAAA
ncbi:hypothetical protein EOD42_20385 [Rhodovarius crocodyli]|uniref:DNA-directed DNA polymerase family A palm domain-containing protein n=1 Tax=Rhodovarius crocodyli TaxID=1979269 RepID=A0A437M1X0_9PROT|nr:hypothetical protein [Rhodovarius crocodyli]RVT91687.1 hypothetical protein EOD42_20385 [Rhodovarius crocodyli]